MNRDQLITLIKTFYPESDIFDTTAEELADEILKMDINVFSSSNTEYKPSEKELKQLVTGQ